MKQNIFLLAAAATILSLTGCRPDPYPIDLDYNVDWNDYDNSGTHTPADDLTFNIRASSTDPDPEDQFITEWEFSYEVNGNYGGVLQFDEGIGTNTVDLSALVIIENLNYPGPGQFKPGDRLSFRFWAVDNHGTNVERYYDFVLE